MCVRVRVRACVAGGRACVCVCACVCVRSFVVEFLEFFLNPHARALASLSRFFSLSLFFCFSQWNILAHSTSSTDAASTPMTAQAMALLADARRLIVPSRRRAVPSASSVPCRVSCACAIVSRWRCRSDRMETPSSYKKKERRGVDGHVCGRGW